MQGLDINSSNFDPTDLKNDQAYVNYNPNSEDPPYVNTTQRSNEILSNPPSDQSNQVAAWYDTDL